MMIIKLLGRKNTSLSYQNKQKFRLRVKNNFNSFLLSFFPASPPPPLSTTQASSSIYSPKKSPRRTCPPAGVRVRITHNKLIRIKILPAKIIQIPPPPQKLYPKKQLCQSTCISKPHKYIT